MRPPLPVGAILLALACLAFHLPYLPESLEDLDSINFALGVRSFDVTQHQPHPPGYPLFILMAKIVHRWIPSEPKSLAILSVAAGTLGVLVLFAWVRRVDAEQPAGSNGRWPLLGTLLAATSPLYWFTAARPLSDITGFVAALAVQLLNLRATTIADFVLASFAAGFTAGIRSQIFVLTAPLLLFAVARRRELDRLRLAAACVAGFVAGVVLWAVPLVVVSGGLTAYWRALFGQGAEDLTGIQMLWTTPTIRVLASALYYAFVAPWARWELAAFALLLAAAGFVQTYRRAPAALLIVAVAFVPYFAFDVLFQETFTTRYALPLIVPIAYLAVRGAAAAGPRLGVAMVIVMAAVGAHVAGTSVAAYARHLAPAFQLLADMRIAARTADRAPVLAPDRRQDLDLRRPIAWVGDAMPQLADRLPAPPKHEWLEPVKYWNSGGRAPVWFVVDPKRAVMDLVDHGDPTEYRWALPYPVLIGGVRPNEMDWYRLDRPEWYAGEGWALTPETAGTAAEDHRGPGFAPIQGWIRRRHEPVTALIGGRNLGSEPSPRVRIALGGQQQDEWPAPPGFFVKMVELPPASTGEGDYVNISIAADSKNIAIEQFDAGPRDRVIFGYGEGWLEQDYDKTTGLRGRWLSERGQLQVRGIGRPLTLRIDGESPRKYYARPSRLLVRIGDRVVLDERLSADFSLTATIPAEHGSLRPQLITFETDQVFVPAERSRRSADRRRLGLRIFKCQLRPAS